jgi:hypothetical protein
LRVDERTKNPSKRKNRGERPEREASQEGTPPKGKVDITA